MDDLYYIKECYKEALKAYKKNEVPVGCVIVMDGKIISRAHNLREKKKSVLAHAEIEAIRKACLKTKTKFLDGAKIYITLEPCLMCLGAIVQARISEIIYSAEEPKFGSVSSVAHVLDDYKFNHQVTVSKGLMKEEVEKLMKDFFKDLRNKKS